jgi:DNA modification methylase
MPELEPADLCLTDPPYGIGADKGVGGYGASPQTVKKYNDMWDKRPSKEIFDTILLASRAVIFFGGNYFADILPQSTHWIVWDKVGVMNFKNPFSDCELAWTNLGKKTVKKYFVLQQGFVTSEKARYHPTQKPVALFSLIIDDYLLEGGTVCDPFFGSGTTAIACERLNRHWIGIEISEEYCEIAVKRIENERKQLKLF